MHLHHIILDLFSNGDFCGLEIKAKDQMVHITSSISAVELHAADLRAKEASDRERGNTLMNQTLTLTLSKSCV